MRNIFIARAIHPDQKRAAIQEIPFRRQRISTLVRRYLSPEQMPDTAIWLNDENVTDKDLRCIRVRPGDRIMFAPKVGFLPALWAAAAWVFSNIAVPAAIAYGVQYAVGEIVGQDLPASKDNQGQSFAWDPRTTQIEGAPVPQAFGLNKHHGNIVARWTAVDATGGSSEILYMLLCMGEGPTDGIQSSEIYINDRPITDFSGVTWEESKGTLSQAALTNFSETKLEFRVGTRVTYSGGAVTFSLPRSGFDDIEYTIEFAHGMWAMTKSGDFVTSGLGVLVQIAEVGTESWTTLLNTSITGAQRAPLYKAYAASAQGFTADRTKQYKLKVTKTSTDNSNRRADYVGIRSVRGVVDIAFTRPGKVLLGIKALATADLSGDIDVSCVRKDRIVNTYNGSTWTLQWSQNRAWVVYSMLTQPCITGDGGGTPYAIDHYEGYDPSQLDTAFFYEWSQLCATSADDGKGSTEDLFPCHHIFDTVGELWESAFGICQIGRANLVWQGNVLTGWIDKAWSDDSDLITSENIDDGSWQQEWAKYGSLAGEIIVNYQDADRNYKRIPWPIHNSNAGRYQNAITVEATGIKSRAGASRIGWFALARNELIREYARFTMGKDAVRYKVGDVHPIQRNRPNWGTSYRVVRWINSKTLQLNRTVVATAGDSLYVRSYNPATGDVETTSYTVASINGAKVTITTSFAVQPIFDDVAAIGSSSEIKQYRLTRVDWDGDHSFDISAEIYDSNLYSTDSGTPIMPYSGSTPASLRNSLSDDRFVTLAEVVDLISQHIPPRLDTDIPYLSNITWNDDTPSGGSVSWSATTAGEPLEITYKGTTYNITASNTSNKYIYWVTGNSTFSTTDSQTAMQTALEGGAFMVCTNNGGTAYPAHAVPLLWAGLLQAGTITASLALIGDLAVDTLQIADNAVTLPDNAFTAGKTDLSDGSADEVQSITFTATGDPVKVFCSAIVANEDSSAYDLDTIRVMYSGGAIYSDSYGHRIEAGKAITIAFNFTHTPTSGSTTYSFDMLVNGTTSFDVWNASIDVMLIKK